LIEVISVKLVTETSEVQAGEATAQTENKTVLFSVTGIIISPAVVVVGLAEAVVVPVVEALAAVSKNLRVVVLGATQMLSSGRAKPGTL
jgi:hypothetical protein